MKRPYRIAVADDEQDMREYLQTILPALGHEVVAVASSGRELLEQCRAARPDLVITDIRMPDLDGLDTAAVLNQERPVAVVIVSGYHDERYLQRAQAGSVMAYLVKPVKAPDLEAAIHLALARFEEQMRARQETSELRQALDERKLIERAKGVVMKRLAIDEDEAYRRLRRMASDQNRKLADVAHEVTGAEAVFHELEQRSQAGAGHG